MARRWGVGGLEEGSGGPLASGWKMERASMVQEGRGAEQELRAHGAVARRRRSGGGGGRPGGAVILLRPSGVCGGTRKTQEEERR
jgi:hypothetical protein